MKHDSGDLLTRKLLLSLFPSQALSAGLPAINSLLTTFIIGRFLGSGSLAAIGFVSPLLMLINTVTDPLSTGSQVLCGRNLGSGNRSGIINVFNSTLSMCLGFTLPLMLLLVLLPEQVASLLGARDDSLALTAQYVRGYGIGVVFQVSASCLLPFLFMDNSRKQANIGVTVMVCVNILCNLVNATVLHWGLFGAGLSVALSNICLFLCILPHFLFRSQLFRFRPSTVSFSECGKIIRGGIPAAVNPITLSVWTRIMNGYLFALGGTVAVSAFAIANTFSGLIGTVECGNQYAIRVIASVFIGERDYEKVKRIPIITAKTTGWINLSAYLLLFIFARPLVLLFGADPAFVDLYVLATRLFNFWIVTSIIKVPLGATSEALGNVRLLSFINFMNSFGTRYLACLLFVDTVGLPVVFSVSWIAELVTILIRAIDYTIKAGHLPKSVFRMIYLPDKLSIPPDHMFTASVRSLDEAIDASEQAFRFCKKLGINRKTSFFCSLCIEEICVNIVQHGFPKGKRNDYSADVRVIYEENSVSVLIKDDCPHFDPNRWLALCDSDDPLRGIGIRTVSRLSKKMEYSTNLGLNVLVISI